MFDWELDIQRRAWSILGEIRVYEEHLNSLLFKSTQQIASLKTFAIYNGRERWIGIEVSGFIKKLFIIFGEHRSSCSIVVESHISQGISINPPTIAEWLKLDPVKKTSFRSTGQSDACKHIISEIAEFVREVRSQENDLKKKVDFST